MRSAGVWTAAMALTLYGCGAPSVSDGLSYSREARGMNSEQIAIICTDLAGRKARSDQEVVDQTCAATVLATEAIGRDDKILTEVCLAASAKLVSEYRDRFKSSPSEVAGRC